jgi:hypothetical protein
MICEAHVDDQLPDSNISCSPEMLFNALSVCQTKRNLLYCYLKTQMEYLPSLFFAQDLSSCRGSHVQQSTAHGRGGKHRDAAALALPQTLGQLSCH